MQQAAADAGAIEALMEMLIQGSLDRCEMGECLGCIAAFATGKDPLIIQRIIKAGAIDVSEKRIPILWYMDAMSVGGEVLECLLEGRDDVKQQFVDAGGLQ